VFGCTFGRPDRRATLSGSLIQRPGTVEIAAFHPAGTGVEARLGEIMARALSILESERTRTEDNIPVYVSPGDYGSPIRVPEAPTWIMRVGSAPFFYFEFLEQTAKDLAG